MFWDEVKFAVARKGFVPLQVRSEQLSRYGDSRLGWAWAFSRPLTMALIYSAVFGVLFGANFSIPNYTVFVISGLMAWQIFSATHTQLSHWLLANRGLALQLRFPFLLGPPIVGATALAEYVPGAVVALGASVALGPGPNWMALPSSAVGVIILILTASGTGMMISSTLHGSRDPIHFSDMAIQMLFWFTPVVYPVTLLTQQLANYPTLVTVYQILPTVTGVSMVRGFYWAPAEFDAGPTGIQVSISLAVALVLFLIGMWRVGKTAESVIEQG